MKSIVVGLIVGILVGTASLAAGLSLPNDKWNDQRGRGDAPVARVNTSAKDVYAMPDRFSNVAMSCDRYGNAIYVTTKSDYSRGLFVIKDGCE